MTSAYPNDTVPWLALLRWLEAQGGEATLQRALTVWGHKQCIEANVAGDVSAPRAEAGQWSMLVLTDKGRAKL